MAAKPDLVIPLRLDIAEALRQLQKLEADGKKGGDKLKEGFDEAGTSAKTLGDRIGDVLSHQGYQMLKDAAMLAAQGFKESADYVREISKEYVVLRETLQQVAALTGKQNSGTFTSDQARAAEQAGLKPEEWVKFQENFQSYAGAYLEGDQRKLSDGDAVKYQQRLATFAKARGIPADQVAQLGGGILQFSPGMTTADDAMAALGRQFKTLERAPTPVSQLLPQMTRIMAQGASGEDTSQLLGIMSEAMPGEEGTGVENTLKAIQTAILKGKAGEIGVTKDMNPLQRIKAAAQNLVDRQDRGEDVDKVMADFFPDLREMRGIKGFMNRGIRARGFERTAGYAAETPDDFTQQASNEYLESDAGRYAREQAGLARAKVERGEQYKELEEAKVRAEKELTAEGRFENVEGPDLLRYSTSFYRGSRRDQMIQERAYYNAQEAAGDLDPDGGKNGTFPFTTEQNMNLAILDELKKANAMRAAAGKNVPAPLSAPPARPATR